MNAKLVPVHIEESLREDGMLFVRTDSILETMAKAPLLLAGLLFVSIVVPLQTSFSSTRSLELTVYSDGSTHITTQLDIDPLEPDLLFDLHGTAVDNFVAVGDNGYLLSSQISGDKATIETLGSSTITINYDVHDLISKEGRVWTFSFNSPSNYSLLMPKNSIVVGMNVLPSDMQIIDDQTKLVLSPGEAAIDYILATTGTISDPIPETPNEPSFDYSIVALVGGTIAATVGGAIMMIKRKKQPQATQTISSSITPETNPMSTETIFSLRPEMRDDDKELVKFLVTNGGQALESELRKKFLQPRTTMWRAVKRLERLGIIEIQKKDMQNLVRLKKEVEEE